MILLEPGYNGSVPDAAYIRIDGLDYKISELTIIEDKPNQLISISRYNINLYDLISYDLFSTDTGGSLTPVASYDDLLDALRALNTYSDPGVKARKLRSTASTNVHLVKVGPTLLHAVLAMNAGGASAYLKLFDVSNTPDPATETPVITLDTRLLPAGPLTFGANVNFRKGLAIAVVAGADDGDNTPVGLGDVILTLLYE
jgi:hypothetical protein